MGKPQGKYLRGEPYRRNRLDASKISKKSALTRNPVVGSNKSGTTGFGPRNVAAEQKPVLSALKKALFLRHPAKACCWKHPAPLS
jgi:hypothetical protein